MPFGGEILRKLKNYKPTKFKAKDSYYDKEYADFAVAFIESLCHTKGTWAGKRFELMDWQEQIIRDLFGILKPNGYRQFIRFYFWQTARNRLTHIFSQTSTRIRPFAWNRKMAKCYASE